MSQGELEVRDARARFNQAIRHRDVMAIAALHAQEYRALTSLNRQVSGKEEAIRVWATQFTEDTSEYYVRTPRKVRVNEASGQAEELGDWEGSRLQNGERVTVSGTYAAKWIRSSTRWTLLSEVFTLGKCMGNNDGCGVSDGAH